MDDFRLFHSSQREPAGRARLNAGVRKQFDLRVPQAMDVVDAFDGNATSQAVSLYWETSYTRVASRLLCLAPWSERPQERNEGLFILGVQVQTKNVTGYSVRLVV